MYFVSFRILRSVDMMFLILLRNLLVMFLVFVISVFVDILLSTQNINDENMGTFFSRVKKLNMTDKSNQHRPLGVKSSLASVAVFL